MRCSFTVTSRVASVQGASLAAVAQIGVVGGPAGLALLVGLSAGILANRATEKVSVVQIGQFVAERAASRRDGNKEVGGSLRTNRRGQFRKRPRFRLRRFEIASH